MSHFSIAAALSLTLLAGVSMSPGGPHFPQDKPDPAAAQGKARFVLDVGEHVLIDVVEKSGAFLSWNILTTTDEVVTNTLQRVLVLQKPLALDAAQCRATVSQFLWAHGAVIVPLDPSLGTYEVLSTQGQRRNEIYERAIAATPEEIHELRFAYTPVFTTVELTHMNASQASNSLRPILMNNSGSGIVIGSLSERSVIVRGMARDVDAVLEVMKRADLGSEQQRTTTEQWVEQRLVVVEQRLQALEHTPRDGR